MFRNACTVQPKAWPAGGAGTVAGSELIRIPSPRGTRPIEDAHSAAPPIAGSGRLPQLDLALGTRHRDRLGPITVLPTHPNQHQATPAIKEETQCRGTRATRPASRALVILRA